MAKGFQGCSWEHRRMFTIWVPWKTLKRIAVWSPPNILQSPGVLCPPRKSVSLSKNWWKRWRSQVRSLPWPWQALEIGSSACLLSHFSRVQLFVTLRTTTHQDPLTLGFSRQEYWSGLPCPPLGHIPDPGIEPASPVLVGRFFTTAQPGKLYLFIRRQNLSQER